MYKDLTQFKFYCQKVLPLVYDDSLSYYEVLGKIVNYINNMIENQQEFQEVLSEHTTNINELNEELQLVQTELEKVKDGDYVSLYIDSLASWIDNNLQELMKRMTHYIAFGLNDDGYFVAYVPEQWEFITFDTNMDFSSNDYGKLILNY